jgi:replication factor A1
LRQKPSIGGYLAFLSIKYEVNPEKFLHALRSAKEHKKSRCGKLSVQCRGKTKNKFIFLIKRASEVVAQFPIDEEFLLNRSNQLGNFTETEKIRRYLTRKAKTATASSIKDLRAGMHHVNLKAKILEVEETKHVVTRHGNHASVAKALIADETGTIKLCLWNGQISSVSAGDTVKIDNAHVSSFRGERLMSLGKKGTLSNVENFKPQVKSINLTTPQDLKNNTLSF